MALIPEVDTKNVLIELKNTIHTQIQMEFLSMNLATITPLIREQNGIRNEVLR